MHKLACVNCQALPALRFGLCPFCLPQYDSELISETTIKIFKKSNPEKYFYANHHHRILSVVAA